MASTFAKDPTQELPAEHQHRQPGVEHEMQPRPQYYSEKYKPAGKLEGKVALITGGDSGIGRSIACLYAAEGAQIAFTYKGDEEEKDKDETCQAVENLTHGKCKALAIPVDLGYHEQCKRVVDATVEKFGRIDILVNNASEQFFRRSLDEITPEALERTYRSNIFSMFYLTKYAVPHMKEGSCIINTTSVTAYQGEPNLLDYESTKGAILAFTRGLALHLVSRGIRVNGVAPGPIWTPLTPSSFPEEKVEKGKFGMMMAPMQRVGQPVEVATSYVFLASDEASYFSGQVLHPNGGGIVNG